MGGAPHLDKVAVEHVVRHIGTNQESCMAYLRTTGYKFRNSRFRELYNEVMETAQETELPGFLEAPDKRREKATGKTFVFTCAQNNTALHDKFWQSLMHYIADNDAKLHVSRFVYNKNTMASELQKADTSKVSDDDGVWYDKRIEPYVSDTSLQIAPSLVWCGELNIIPTRVHPLSTLKTYTRGNSAIIPHVKMRMDSVPTMKDADPVFLYTTGAVTKRNYIQRVAGQVAEFHHVFGAMVVEVDDDGNWWSRQINADINGCFYDLDTYWTPDGYSDGHRLAAITHGDIHGLKADWDIMETVFDEGGILDQLMPHEQFMHDTIDFMPRNHHNIKDPHFLWAMHKDQNESVEYEFSIAARILHSAHRTWCKTVVVVSNHDQALGTWLKNTAAFTDPVNVEFWLRCNLWVYRNGVGDVFITALNDKLSKQVRDAIAYVREDESYSVYGTNIEGGVHGHLGPSGARGNPLNLRTVGKANTAHTHSAGIVDGIYTAGVYGTLDMGYNKGLSSWSHSFIATYLNGKRAILTIKHGKAWRDAHVRKG
jgi:hypothetical protein